MNAITVRRQQLTKAIATLPDEAVLELANFLDYLQYKLSSDPSAPISQAPELSGARILANIAALPLEGKTDGFSGREHDRILYS